MLDIHTHTHTHARTHARTHTHTHTHTHTNTQRQTPTQKHTHLEAPQSRTSIFDKLNEDVRVIHTHIHTSVITPIEDYYI